MNMNSFSTLLVDYFKENGLPHVRFTNNSSLGILTKQLMGNSAHINPSLTPSRQVAKYVDDFVAACDGENRLPDTKQLDQIADLMAGKIGESFTALKSCRADVSSLVNTINTGIEQQLAKNATYLTFMAAQAADPEFNKIDWDGILVIGGIQDIILTVHDAMEYESNLPSRAIIARFVYKFESAPVDALLAKETINEMVEAFKEILPEIAPEAVRETINLINSKQAITRLTNRLVNVVNNDTTVMSSVLQSLNRIQNMQPILKACVDFEGIELADSTIASINNNVKAIQHILTAEAYYVLFHRQVTYQQALVLPNRMLNSDIYPQFIEAGGTDKDIAQYLSYNYKENTALPPRGIQASYITDATPAITAKLTKHIASAKSTIAMAKKRALMDNVQRALVTYATDLNAIGNNIARNNYVKAFSERAILAETPLENVLYDFVISMRYPKSFVSLLYRKLGAAYVKDLADSAELDDTDINLIESAVCSELVVDFLLEQFVVATD